MTHTSCANMFFHVLGVKDKETNESMTLIAQAMGVLGRPLAGQDPGRVRNVRYEAVGEQIDLRPFWSPGSQPGGDVFNWKALSQSKYNFLVVRPFMYVFYVTLTTGRPIPHYSTRFPRLLDVAPSRTAHFRNVEFNNQDKFTTLPLDILQILLPYLPMVSYLSLVSTCRFLRLHALTTFQPNARRLVLGIPWSLPLPADLSLMSPSMAAKVPDREKTPHTADWLLYLSHIHCTNSMRTRRWIWALAESIKDTYLAQLATSPVMDPATHEYKVLHDALERAFELAGMEPTPAGECETQVVAVAY